MASTVGGSVRAALVLEECNRVGCVEGMEVVGQNDGW